jgi:alkylation response protein AidB-like acyl-CoA dehydrogenase
LVVFSDCSHVYAIAFRVATATTPGQASAPFFTLGAPRPWPATQPPADLKQQESSRTLVLVCPHRECRRIDRGMTMNQVQNPFHRHAPHSLVVAAASLRSRLIERMAETDEIRRLPDATVADLKEAGLMTALVPKEYGGAGVDFRTFFDIVQELGRADGSVAWTYAVLCCGSWMVATFFPESVSKEVFQSSNPLTSAVMAPTTLTARMVDGGIQIDDGQWTFNTGIHHAGWNIVGIPIIGPQGTPTDLLSGLVSTEQLTVVDDWNALGLRAQAAVP